jgi:hypothetical protein
MSQNIISVVVVSQTSEFMKKKKILLKDFHFLVFRHAAGV